MKTTNKQFENGIKIRNAVIIVMTVAICVLSCFLIQKPQTAPVSFFEQVIRSYSNAIFECTEPNSEIVYGWGVFEQEKFSGKASNFQEREINFGLADFAGYLQKVYPDSGGISLVAVCPSSGQAQKLSEILATLKAHGSTYGEINFFQ